MKKKVLSLLAFLGLISYFAVFTQEAKADVDYDITNMDVTAKVNRDGSLTMHRRIDYEFDSDAHGVFYKQNLAKKQNLTGVKVKVNGQSVVSSNSGKNNTYQLTRSGDSYLFKVFHRIDEDDNVKVEYSYRILNAITRDRKSVV